jgi:hypothetical protein
MADKYIFNKYNKVSPSSKYIKKLINNNKINPAYKFKKEFNLKTNK